MSPSRPSKLGTSIKYLGSKEKLLPAILKACQHIPYESVLDLFAGSGRVAYAFRRQGKQVFANDYLLAAATQTAGLLSPPAPAALYEAMSRAPSLPLTHWWCDAADGYITRDNAAAIGGMRLFVDTAPSEHRSALLASLMVALGRVDACIGQYAAHLKGNKIPPRTRLDVRSLLEPLGHVVAPESRVACLDAQELVDGLPEGFYVDLVYLDPPYGPTVNYPRYYHLLDTLVRFDDPPTAGVTRKRPNDYPRSPWCSRAKDAVENALIALLKGLQGKTGHVLLSFSNEVVLPKDRLVQILLQHGGPVVVSEVAHKAHMGRRVKVQTRESVVEYLFHVRMRGHSLETTPA